MFTLENRANGFLIGYASVQRVDINEKEYIYEVEYPRINKEPPVIKFQVFHKIEDVVEKLALQVYKQLNKQLSKKQK